MWSWEKASPVNPTMDELAAPPSGSTYPGSVTVHSAPTGEMEDVMLEGLVHRKQDPRSARDEPASEYLGPLVDALAGRLPRPEHRPEGVRRGSIQSAAVTAWTGREATG